MNGLFFHIFPFTWEWFGTFFTWCYIYSNYIYMYILVGGMVNFFFIFPFSWEVHNPNWRTPSFFRGVGNGRYTTNQYIYSTPKYWWVYLIATYSTWESYIYMIIYVYIYIYIQTYVYIYIYICGWIITTSRRDWRLGHPLLWPGSSSHGNNFSIRRAAPAEAAACLMDAVFFLGCFGRLENRWEE